jgi:hypothetical protein
MKVLVLVVVLVLVLATPVAAQDFWAETREQRAAWAAYCYPYAAYTDPYTGESWCVGFSFGPYIAE